MRWLRRLPLERRRGVLLLRSIPDGRDVVKAFIQHGFHLLLAKCGGIGRDGIRQESQWGGRELPCVLIVLIVSRVAIMNLQLPRRLPTRRPLTKRPNSNHFRRTRSEPNLDWGTSHHRDHRSSRPCGILRCRSSSRIASCAFLLSAACAAASVPSPPTFAKEWWCRRRRQSCRRVLAT